MRIYNRDPITGRIRKGHTELSKDQRDEKFWDNVAIIPFHPCWEWIGPKDEKGYGRFHVGNHKYSKAHNYSLSLVEEINPTMVRDHICRNRGCVNPKHLRQVSSRTNTLENSRSNGAINKIKTHCKYGHEFSPGNTGINCNGGRWCKECNRNRGIKNKSSTKAEIVC